MDQLSEIETVNEFLKLLPYVEQSKNDGYVWWMFSDGKHWMILCLFPKERTISFSLSPVGKSLRMPDGAAFISTATTYSRVSLETTREAGENVDRSCLRFEDTEHSTSFDLIKADAGALHVRTVINRESFPSL
jgi:hypothetical protein